MQAIRGLYIFVLASLLILTGCMGGGVIDEADGQTDENGNDDTTGTGSSSTTIINNYYNNTTVVEDEIELFSSAGISTWIQGTDTESDDYPKGDCETQGGIYDTNNMWPSPVTCNFEVKTIETQSGELLTIIENRGVYLQTTCMGVTMEGLSEGEVFGSAFDCTHVLIHDAESAGDSNGQTTPGDLWSIVYMITPVTVV